MFARMFVDKCFNSLFFCSLYIGQVLYLLFCINSVFYSMFTQREKHVRAIKHILIFASFYSAAHSMRTTVLSVGIMKIKIKMQ